MTDQWMRKCKITFPGGTYTLDETNFNTALRVRFQLHGYTAANPNTASVTITNPNPALRTQLKDWAGKSIQVDAGYVSNCGMIFKGEIIQAAFGRESPTDTYLKIVAGSLTFAHARAMVNKTFKAGSTQMDHVKEAVAAMSKISPLTIGFIGPDLTKLKYPRAVTLFRSAAGVLFDIAKANKANHSYQNGKLHMVTDEQTIPGGAIILNAKTGLIGTPTQTMHGIVARCLINPDIVVNGTVYIDQNSINPSFVTPGFGLAEGARGQIALTPTIAADGLYKVLQIDADADTRGNPWYMDLTMEAKNTPSVGDVNRTGQGLVEKGF